MKPIIAVFLLCGCVTKQPMLTPFIPAQPPTTSTVVYEPGPALQAYRGEFGVVVYWTSPDTNLWLPQWSTNLVDWNGCAARGSDIPPRMFRQSGVRCTECRYFADVTTDWTGTWYFRLIKK